MSSEIASFEDVKNLRENVLLIDVREPNELEEFGSIPNSINIPLDQVEEVLKNATPKDFKNKFGKDKPNKDTDIIFTCRSGRRSLIAQDAAKKLGFTKTRNYVGGWLDWEQHIKM